MSKNKTINFNVPLTNNDGKKVEGQNLSKVLSEFIGTQTKGQTLKLYGWHKSLQVNDPLMLDEADQKTLTDLIENSETLFVFVKGQLLDVIKKT
jgi:hypothetical protein